MKLLRRLTVLCSLCATPVLLAAEPESIDAVVDKLHELRQQDAWVEALEVALEAHQRSAEDPRIIAELGAAYLRAGKLEESASILAALEEREDAPPTGLITLARLRAAEGRSEDAGRLLDAAVRAAPKDEDVLYWAADLHGDRARSIELLERYLEVSTDPRRAESVRGTLALFESLEGRPLWVAEASPRRVELPLIRLKEPGGATTGFAVSVRLGSKDKPLHLLLDTGSHRLFVLEKAARKRGFVPLSNKTLYGGGGSRRHTTRLGVMDRFVLGDLRYSQVLVTTTRSRFDDLGRFHGLLGISVLGGYRVVLDLVDDRLIFEQPQGDARGEPYWWFSGQMLVKAGAPSAEPCLFVFDSGATRTVVDQRFVDGIDASFLTHSTGIRGFGGMIQGARIVRGLEIEFQGRGTGGRPIVAYDRTVENRMAGIEAVGLVGLDLLDGRRTEIDTATQRIRALDEGP